VINKEVGVE